MQMTRRNVLMLGAGVATLAGIGARPAFASAADDIISAFTGGAATTDGSIVLTAPEIAENGNTVPIEFSAPGAKSVLVMAEGNPAPKVATFNFGKLAGSRKVATRIRLAKSQNVVIVAAMEDGSFVRAQAAVKVTIGGCGG